MNRRECLKLGTSAVAGMTFTSIANASEEKPETEIKSFLDVIKERRSVRQYKSDPVPEEHLMEIVDAARMAPCAGNEQAWKFIIIQDKEKIEALTQECVTIWGDGVRGRLSAPAYIVVLVDTERQWPTYNQHDGPLAAGYLLLAARALGYGTVYMTDSIPENVTRKIFNIPDRYRQVCVTPVGVPVEWPTKEKKPLEEFIVKDGF